MQAIDRDSLLSFKIFPCYKWLLTQVAPPPIPLRPPAIPKRNKNEKPIPMQSASRQDNRAMRRKASDSSAASSATIPAATWSNVDSTDQEFIDLGPFRNQNQTSQVRPIISSSRAQLNLRFFERETRTYYKNNSLTVTFLRVWLRPRHCLLIHLRLCSRVAGLFAELRREGCEGDERA